MDNINDILKKSATFKEFAKGYINHLSYLIQKMDVDKIEAFVKELESSRQNGNTIFFVGNGGSAATASHVANDLGLGARRNIEPPLKALSLTDNVPVMTAVANDNGYDDLFLRQIQLHYKPQDKLVAISVSGNSPNVIAVAQWVKEQDGKVISLTGFDGGKLGQISDIDILVETSKGEYGPVEDIHMIVGHLVYTWIWTRDRQETFA
jgi:D-sedoheptulose 7-phosphate isomerase